MRPPLIATKDDMGKFKTAMETRFDAMSKRLDAIEESVQSLQDGWRVVVPDEDDASGTGGPTTEWEVDWNDWHSRRWGWHGCRRRRSPQGDGARVSP